MPKKNDEIMAMADVYAEALLNAAREQGVQDEVAEQFAELVQYMDQDAAFEQFLVSDNVDDDPRRVSLEKMFRGRINDLLLNTLQVLNNRYRLDLVREVYRAVELRMEAQRDQQEVVVETAMPLTDDLRSLLKSRVSEYIGKEALLIEKVVPELIGGIVIHVKDVQIDASVSSRVRELRHSFSKRAIREIHDGRGVEV